MTNWPDKPLICVLDGEVNEDGVADELAYRFGDGAYTLISEEHMDQTIVRDAYGDVIVKWEEVTAVPTAALEEFKAAWKGFGMYDPDDSQRVTDAITTILSYLPADNPSPLDRAVTRVLDAGGPMVTEGDPKDNRLSLLFDALASVAVATNKAAPLAIVARICVDWANVEDQRGDSLEVMRRRVEVLSESENFIVLSALVADVINALCENLSPRHELIDAGTCALAWVAQIIEEEDK